MDSPDECAKKTAKMMSLGAGMSAGDRPVKPGKKSSNIDHNRNETCKIHQFNSS